MDETLGQRIKRIREERKMTQQAVADYIGVSRVAVTKWESGNSENLKFHNLLKLLKLYAMSFDELVSGKAKRSKAADTAANIIDSLNSDNEKDAALNSLRVFIIKQRDDHSISEVEPIQTGTEQKTEHAKRGH